jgi:hypothetical protein
MRSIAVLLLLSMGSVASADVVGGVGFNISGVLGVGGTRTDHESSGGVAWAFRPELLFKHTPGSRWGLGPFVELGSIGDAGFLAATGATLSIPLTGSLVIAPSAGVFSGTVFDLGWAGGYTAGAFFGRRDVNDISYFDASIGIRADYRRSFSGDREGFSVCLQLDLVLIAAFGALM